MKKAPETTKLLLVAALAVICTGAGSYVTFGQDKVTRPEMKDYVEGELRPVNRLERAVEKLSDQQLELLVGQKRLETLIENR